MNSNTFITYFLNNSTSKVKDISYQPSVIYSKIGIYSIYNIILFCYTEVRNIWIYGKYIVWPLFDFEKTAHVLVGITILNTKPIIGLNKTMTATLVTV